jgi:hypothetical protein
MSIEAPKKRGRPRKHPAPDPTTPKRARGRPKKYVIDARRTAVAEALTNSVLLGQTDGENTALKVFNIPVLTDPSNRDACLGFIDFALDLSFGAREHSLDPLKLKAAVGYQFVSYFKGKLLKLSTHRPPVFKQSAKKQVKLSDGARAKYTANPEFMRTLHTILGLDFEAALLNASARLGLSFEAPFGPRTSQGEYNGKRVYSARLNLRSDFRSHLFVQVNGSGTEHDMQTCKQTLMLQFARRYGSVRAPFWDAYVRDPASVRAVKAEQWGVSVQQVKEVMQQIFGGADPGTSDEPKFFCSLIQNAVITRNDLRTILADPDTPRMLTERDAMAGVLAEANETLDIVPALNAKGRAQSLGQFLEFMYETLEDRVMSVVAKKLDQDALYLHDAFVLVRALPKGELDDLERLIELETGFEVKFKAKALNLLPEWT